jgi:KinB signaling pathway activation protein
MCATEYFGVCGKHHLYGMMGLLRRSHPMRLNQFIFLIASTVILGAVVGILVSFSGLWIHVPWFLGLITGAFLATTSLMGFWAYLTLNFIAGITLPRRVWRWAQFLILAMVVYDMLWWRYHINVAKHPVHHYPFSLFLIQGIWPLVIALIAAIFKYRISGKGSYLPTVFYLYVFTVVDWLLVIKAHAGPVVNATGIIMMACNVYMILIFRKLLTKEALNPGGHGPHDGQLVDQKPSLSH